MATRGFDEAKVIRSIEAQNAGKRLKDGTMKRLVSLVDRNAIDNYLYPPQSKETFLQPSYQNYHNFSSEVLESNYTGNAAWGQRITFQLPANHNADLLNWCSLVIQPGTWVPQSFIPGLLQDNNHCFQPLDISGTWLWAPYLGQIAIEKAELEIDGIVIDTIDGDWCTISSTAYLNRTQAALWADGISGPRLSPFRGTVHRRQFMVQPTEDGRVWCYLPFWFARRKNTGFPICSLQGKSFKIHITLRSYENVVRKWAEPRECEETPAGDEVKYRDFSYNWKVFSSWKNSLEIPTFKNASMLFGVTYLSDPLRAAYVDRPHEILIEQVKTMRFYEPLKYALNKTSADSILVGLPLTALNGPLRRLFFFVRRKAVSRYNEWSNYGACMEDEIHVIYNPQRPLLKKAKLLVGTVVLADQPEEWWRYNSAKTLPGSISLYDNYIYTIGFDGDNETFGPQGGTLNASRVDIRLDLEVEPPSSSSGITNEWEVVVFALNYNWLRFQNGIANLLYAD